MSTATKPPSCREGHHGLKGHLSRALPSGDYRNRVDAQEIIDSLKKNL